MPFGSDEEQTALSKPHRRPVEKRMRNGAIVCLSRRQWVGNIHPAALAASVWIQAKVAELTVQLNPENSAFQVAELAVFGSLKRP